MSPDVQGKGREFGDFSLSLSANYTSAVEAAGGVPLTLSPTTSPDAIRAAVHACDGVLLTGGDDVAPELYGRRLPRGLRQTVAVTPDGGARDFRELVLVHEALRLRKPLLAICRGHQLLNVALGGTLVADISRELPKALDHRRMDKRNETVHEVRLTRGSLIASITGVQTLAVNSTHHQAVARVAQPLLATALSTDGVIEGLELKKPLRRAMPFLLSVQFHPERLADRHWQHLAIFRAFVSACVSEP